MTNNIVVIPFIFLIRMANKCLLAILFSFVYLSGRCPQTLYIFMSAVCSANKRLYICVKRVTRH